MMTTARQALALLAREGVMTLVPAAGRRSLVEEITGGPIKGSWWGHAQGKTIYALATALEASPDVLVAKLVAGKVSFVHRELWPALVRVVTDEGWRRDKARGLGQDARRLLATVEKQGEAEIQKGDRAARVELEARALVHARSEHTERGAHAAVLRSWRTWGPGEVGAAARKLSMDAARARLAAVGIEL